MHNDVHMRDRQASLRVYPGVSTSLEGNCKCIRHRMRETVWSETDAALAQGASVHLSGCRLGTGYTFTRHTTAMFSWEHELARDQRTQPQLCTTKLSASLQDIVSDLSDHPEKPASALYMLHFCQTTHCMWLRV